jgi:GT2 family glycosyltransferase
VCIANWNCCNLLRGCLRSLASGRQGVRVEVIVADNASTDGAPAMVASQFPRVRLLCNARNEGFARASNQAARQARGRYLLFLNNDTVVPPGALRRLVEQARACPDAGLIGPRLINGRGRTQCSVRCRPTVPALLHRISWLRWTGLFRAAYRRYRGRDTDSRTTRPAEVLMGAALLMPRRIYRALGGWDEGFTFGAEDIDLCVRVARRWRVLYHPSVSITHFGRASSRLHPGFAHAHTVIGIARNLRQAGTPRLALWAYKLAFTLDAPIQLVAQGVRYLWCQLRGKQRQAERALLALRGVVYFVARGLVGFWKA